MIALLDANVLIALTVTDHVHHDAVDAWLAGTHVRVASCPITQGALVRFLLRAGSGAAVAVEVLASLRQWERHEFWPDDLEFGDVDLRGVIGHRQVSDAYLCALARARHATLLTLDRGLVALHSDVAILLEPPA